jgi:hypothetical protein
MLWSFKLPKQRSYPRDSITKLVYIPQYFTKDSDGDKSQVPAKLEIWTGVDKIEFSANSSLIKSEAELEWIAHELSNWLGIEVSS